MLSTPVVWQGDEHPSSLWRETAPPSIKIQGSVRAWMGAGMGTATSRGRQARVPSAAICFGPSEAAARWCPPRGFHWGIPVSALGAAASLFGGEDSCNPSATRPERSCGSAEASAMPGSRSAGRCDAGAGRVSHRRRSPKFAETGLVSGSGQPQRSPPLLER